MVLNKRARLESRSACLAVMIEAILVNESVCAVKLEETSRAKQRIGIKGKGRLTSVITPGLPVTVGSVSLGHGCAVACAKVWPGQFQALC